jgi:hypothetical protein
MICIVPLPPPRATARLIWVRAGGTRVDRPARSVKDLQDIVHELRGKGVTLKATEQPIDTGTAAGKAFLGMLGVFAESGTNLRKERQMEGIAKAKAKGVYKGRPSTPRRCGTCGRGAWGRRRSRTGWASGGPASTGCSAGGTMMFWQSRRSERRGPSARTWGKPEFCVVL